MSGARVVDLRPRPLPGRSTPRHLRGLDAVPARLQENASTMRKRHTCRNARKRCRRVNQRPRFGGDRARYGHARRHQRRNFAAEESPPALESGAAALDRRNGRNRDAILPSPIRATSATRRTAARRCAKGRLRVDVSRLPRRRGPVERPGRTQSADEGRRNARGGRAAGVRSQVAPRMASRRQCRAPGGRPFDRACTFTKRNLRLYKQTGIMCRQS